MKRKYATKEEALNVAKEAIWLAWNACGGPAGMGFLQNKPNAEKEKVWEQAYNQGDYALRHGGPERVSADYVFGRMMKLRFKLDGDTIDHDDYEPRRDYQAWCGTYKTFSALFDAAEGATNIKQTESDKAA